MSLCAVSSCKNQAKQLEIVAISSLNLSEHSINTLPLLDLDITMLFLENKKLSHEKVQYPNLDYLSQQILNNLNYKKPPTISEHVPYYYVQFTRKHGNLEILCHLYEL